MSDYEVTKVPVRIFTILLEDEMRATLDRVARSEGVSTGHLMRRLLVAALRAEGHDIPDVKLAVGRGGRSRGAC